MVNKTTKPLIIAHRGASGEALENTLAAFELAYQQGADGIELDIYVTADQKLVVIHDETTARVSSQDVPIRTSSWNLLKNILLRNGETIPLLDQVFDLYGEKFSVFNIEIKSTGLYTDGIEALLVQLIEKYQLAEKVVVSSFNPLHLWRLKRLAPKIRRGFLAAKEHRLARNTLWFSLTKPTNVHLDWSWSQQGACQQYITKAPHLWWWTVNEINNEMEMRFLSQAQAIITNYPRKLAHEFSQFKS